MNPLQSLPVLLPSVDSALPQHAARECGGCMACCVIMHVPALEKSEYTPCPQLCAHGCSIYADRPSVCRTWECAWKSGWIHGDERRRPDKLGVMFEYRLIGGRPFLWAHEVWPGSLDDPNLRHLLEEMQRNDAVVTSRHGSMEIAAETETIEFLALNLKGGIDKPILPTQPVVDNEGNSSGTLITKKVGNEFIRTVVASAPGQRDG